jgi:peptidyl-Lys metalloendopeptidase
MSRSLAVLVVLALIMAAGPVAAAPPDTGVAVSLTAEKTSLTTSEDVLVRFTATNTTGRARSLYLWSTPLVEVEHDLFVVQRDGERVPYLGIEAKRGPATKDDFRVLRPGESASTMVELSALYDMGKPGVYTVQYLAGAKALVPAAAVSAGAVVSSDAVEIELTGEERASAVLAPAAPAPGAATVAYRKCTNTQQSQLPAALSAAQSYASGASSSLTGSAGARYTTWFGVYDSGRYNTVKSHFSALQSALTTQTILFDCGCKKNYYAYVYPTRPYEIYVCRVFWQVPNTGTDSRGGTIIHETSHFNVVASTDDWVYGQSGAMSLAQSDPTKAIDNADSHEYYAENNPALR